MGGNEQKYVQEAFDSNCSNGAKFDDFRRKFRDYLGSGHVAVLNSGTAAIHLGLI
jgi:dTDP-4-amino-4,6-dideoxygalactose transaminase